MPIVPNFTGNPRTGYNPLPVTLTNTSTGTDPVFTKVTTPDQLAFTDVATQGKYCLASTSGGFLYYSTDFGVTWSIASPPAPTSGWVNVAISSSRDSLGAPKIPVFYACCSTDGKIYRSLDEGISWSGVYVAANLNKVRCCGDGSIVVTKAGTTGFLWISTNYGVTFTDLLSSPASAVYDLDVSDNNGTVAIIVSLGTTVTISTDNGVTWVNQLALPNTIGNYSVAALYWGTTGNYNFFAGGNAGNGYLYKMSSNNHTGVWDQQLEFGYRQIFSIRKGLVERQEDREVIGIATWFAGYYRIYLLHVHNSSSLMYPTPGGLAVRPLAISNPEPGGYNLLAAAENLDATHRDLYVGKFHIANWYIDSGSGYSKMSIYNTSLVPFVKEFATGTHSVKLIIDTTSGTEEKINYIAVRAPILNSLVIEEGRIVSWTKTTLVSAPTVTKTHTISISNGKITSWSIFYAGSRPDPEVTRTVVINKGYIQSWT